MTDYWPQDRAPGARQLEVDADWTPLDGRKLEIHPAHVQLCLFFYIGQVLIGWTRNWTKLDTGWMDAPPPRGRPAVHL